MGDEYDGGIDHFDDLPTKDCDRCGSEVISDQVLCPVCGGEVDGC